jgi:cation diffusion facilitator family transporter
MESGARHGTKRDRDVRRVILIEGSANVAVLFLKLGVGLTTGSLAILGDALHSVGDLANNAVAWFLVRVSSEPPDPQHPYGHRKFETLAVFGLAALLCILAFELGASAFRREDAEVLHTDWSLGLMVFVMATNLGLAFWQDRQATRLESPILRADARHTLSDALTTVVVIAGWQIASHGYPWVDRAFALGVALVILVLAYELFRRALPVLLDQAAIDPALIRGIAQGVPGVHRSPDVRSRSDGIRAAIDLTVTVDAHLTTAESHQIADQVERVLQAAFANAEVSVHVEPELASAGRRHGT